MLGLDLGFKPLETSTSRSNRKMLVKSERYTVFHSPGVGGSPNILHVDN